MVGQILGFLNQICIKGQNNLVTDVSLLHYIRLFSSVLKQLICLRKSDEGRTTYHQGALHSDTICSFFVPSGIMFCYINPDSDRLGSKVFTTPISVMGSVTVLQMTHYKPQTEMGCANILVQKNVLHLDLIMKKIIVVYFVFNCQPRQI